MFLSSVSKPCLENLFIIKSVIDAMQVVQNLQKPDNVKIFKDLAQVFVERVICTSSGCTTIIVAFDEYRPPSLKAAMRKKRISKKIPVQYSVNAQQS